VRSELLNYVEYWIVPLHIWPYVRTDNFLFGFLLNLVMAMCAGDMMDHDTTVANAMSVCSQPLIGQTLH